MPRLLLRLVLFALVAAIAWPLLSGNMPGAQPFGLAMRAGAATPIERVVDGDTLVATVDGQRRRVRVLGIDTPESVKPGAAVEPCGRAASRRARSWLRRHPAVRLVADDAAPDEDRYGRLLRWVQPTDGTSDLSRTQVAAGLARVKAYGQDLHGLGELRRAEAGAKRAGRGVWGTGCAG